MWMGGCIKGWWSSADRLIQIHMLAGLRRKGFPDNGNLRCGLSMRLIPAKEHKMRWKYSGYTAKILPVSKYRIVIMR